MKIKCRFKAYPTSVLAFPLAAQMAYLHHCFVDAAAYDYIFLNICPTLFLSSYVQPKMQKTSVKFQIFLSNRLPLFPALLQVLLQLLLLRPRIDNLLGPL